MTFHTPRDWSYGEKVTEQMLDEQIKDNLNEIWKFDGSNQIWYSTGSSTANKTTSGSVNGSVLVVVSGSPTWKNLWNSCSLTNSAWDGDSKSGSTYTLNAYSTFGVPNTAKAILLKGTTKWAQVGESYYLSVVSTSGGLDFMEVNASIANWGLKFNGVVILDSSGNFNVGISGSTTYTYLGITAWMS